MRMKLAVTSVAAAVVMMVTLMSCTAHSQPDRSSNAPGATQEQFEQWMTEFSNWGRWGDDDEIGAANLITPAKRLQATALVETGDAVSLGHDVVDPAGSDPNRPFGLNMIISFDPGSTSTTTGDSSATWMPSATWSTTARSTTVTTCARRSPKMAARTSESPG